MKLGLLADIHEATPALKSALEHFNRAGVERIVQAGDVCRTGERLPETARLLAEHHVAGVWGNHDFGLCVDVGPELRRRSDPAVLEYMASLRPRLELADCAFAHVEPWLDPNSIEDLWFFGGPPASEDRRRRIFAANRQRVNFAGHYHRWLVLNESGLIAWQGESPLRLEPGRWFVTLGALCAGDYALYDTESRWLEPCKVPVDTLEAD